MLGRLFTPLFLLGLLAIPCCAQSESAPSAPSSPSTTTPASGNPASSATKKTWTNDDLPAAKGSAGDKRNQNARSSASPTVDAATVERIRKNLEKLQAQLDDVNKKLKGYKEFQQGEPVSTGARDMSKGVNRTPVDQQMAQLEDKKKQLEDQIGDLYDEARKRGIDPGQLR